jgi:hypothetical protein
MEMEFILVGVKAFMQDQISRGLPNMTSDSAVMAQEAVGRARSSRTRNSCGQAKRNNNTARDQGFADRGEC